MDKITGVGQQGPIQAWYLSRIERDRKEEIRTVIRAVELLNKTDMTEELGAGNQLDYSFDTKSGRPIIKVVAKSSGEVLFQIPPQSFVEMVARQAARR